MTLEQLQKQLASYRVQRVQAEKALQQLNGAVFVLEHQVNTWTAQLEKDKVQAELEARKGVDDDAPQERIEQENDTEQHQDGNCSSSKSKK